MGTLIWLIYAIFMAAYTTSSYSSILPVENSPDFQNGYISKLHLIGTIEGKSFFADMTRRNWTDSKRVCQNVGMRLASITTLAQKTLLVNAYNPQDFHWWFWTAGRDAQVPSQFIWDVSGGTPSSTVVSSYLRTNGIQTCLAIVIQSSMNGLFDFESCGFPCGVICEIYHGNP